MEENPPEEFVRLLSAMRKSRNLFELRMWWNKNNQRILKLPPEHLKRLVAIKEDLKRKLN